MRDAVIIEQAGNNVSDLPVCVATAATVDAVEREIRDVIRVHIEGLRANGEPVSQPTSIAEYIEA